MTVALSIAELAELAAAIKIWGRELGFQQIGIADIDLREHEAWLLDWLAAGFHGAMDYMARHGVKRSRPAELVPGTVRAITARLDYLPPAAADPWRVLPDPELGYLSAMRWAGIITRCCETGCNGWRIGLPPPLARLAAGSSRTVLRCWKKRWPSGRGWAGLASTAIC